MMRRREFIMLLGGAAAAWPIAARAQQQTLPVVAFVSGVSADDAPRFLGVFRTGLGKSEYVEGRNVAVEYHFLAGEYDRLPGLMADLVRHHVAVIVTPGTNAISVAAKAATSTIPIVFGTGDSPVQLGQVASLPRPGGNATGMSFLNNEANSKRVSLLHELMPKSARLAVLVNPGNSPAMETALREVELAARVNAWPIDILKAGSSREIEESFATIAGERTTALFIMGDTFFTSRRVQLATLAIRHGIAACYSVRDFAVAGGLMSYGADLADMYRQLGLYTGQILKGAKPADLPVVQSTKLEFVINTQTARLLGFEVPANLLAIADEVIE